MTRFWKRIAVWFLLYEPVLIYRSSHESVFESPVYRVYNGRICISRYRVRIVRASPKRCNTQPNIQININIHLTHSLAHWHMRVHSRSHTHASIHIPTPIHTYIYITTHLH